MVTRNKDNAQMGLKVTKAHFIVFHAISNYKGTPEKEIRRAGDRRREKTVLLTQSRIPHHQT